MAEFDYGNKADLFVSGAGFLRRKPLQYKSFRFARDAIRFVMEELSPERLGGVCMEIDEKRFDRDAIQRLYESRDYPLARKSTAPREAKRRRSRDAQK